MHDDTNWELTAGIDCSQARKVPTSHGVNAQRGGSVNEQTHSLGKYTSLGRILLQHTGLFDLFPGGREYALGGKFVRWPGEASPMEATVSSTLYLRR